MDINLNVNINAPELCASINNLATALLMQKTAIVTNVTNAADTPTDKSNFTFNLADTAAAEKVDTPVQDPGGVETASLAIEEAAVKDAATAKKVETTTESTETNNNSAQDTGEADNKPATEEPPKEVQKVEREVIRGVLKAKVDAGKKAQVRAFLDTYGVGISLPNIPEDLVNTEMLAKAEAI